MGIKAIQFQPFSDQKPGTSGLRKKTKTFQEPHYLESFIQSILCYLKESHKDISLLIGGDGRYYNKEAIETILRIAIANNIKKVIIAKDGILSTPSASHLIRKHNYTGGIILSASHNPGGVDGDFGVKFNVSNGGPAPLNVTDRIYEISKKINEYYITDQTINLDYSKLGTSRVAETTIEVIDPINEYAELMQSLFDFELIRDFIKKSRFKFVYDAMNAVTGPYAKKIFEELLGASEGTVINYIPKEDFGGLHPDPNLKHAKELVKIMFSESPLDFAAASDGDGDRNMILGPNFFVTPSDSLAIITAYHFVAPGYKNNLYGVARSMPTSRACDIVAKRLGINCFETPTGWKFFGNLLDANLITFCGEESFGTGSNHIREKDGLWAVLFWLNILAHEKKTLPQIVKNHWLSYGRHYYSRHDYEEIDSTKAQDLIENLKNNLEKLQGTKINNLTITHADDFSYVDPVDNTVTKGQGIRLFFNDDSRAVLRLSGTGTKGATLRVYFEKYEKDNIDADTQEMLAELIQAVNQIALIKEFTGLDKPTTVT